MTISNTLPFAVVRATIRSGVRRGGICLGPYGTVGLPARKHPHAKRAPAPIGFEAGVLADGADRRAWPARKQVLE